MNYENAGSYAFGGFKDDDNELDRLIKQAKIALPAEMDLLKQRGLKKGMNVLDLASGPGVVSCAIGEEVLPGQVLGVDISAELVGVASSYAQEQRTTNVEFENQDVYSLDVGEGQFDFAYARFLFQHMQYPLKALANIKKALKPGGRLLITDVDDDWLTLSSADGTFKRFTELAHSGQKTQGGDRLIGRKLAPLLEQADFKDIDVGILLFTDKHFSMETFLNITTGFKREQIVGVPEGEVNAMLEDIYAQSKRPYCWGYVGVFTVVGTV